MSSSEAVQIPDNLPETDLSEVKPVRGMFEKKHVTEALTTFYSPEQIQLMKDKGVDQRMVFGINSYYMALVKGTGLTTAAGVVVLPVMPPSVALQNLVVPVVAEAADMSGEKDPSNQIRYSPDELKGKILHKYDEITLGYVALACSAHCRYCYRLDLFNGSTGKGMIKPEELRDYVLGYNRNLAAHGGVDPETGKKRWPITEILLSGGDPMVLSNKQLYKYLAAGAEAGVDVVRIGTKEMAFRPMRFDVQFAETLRIFHANYPAVHINIVTHFSHPDEFLERNADGSYRQEKDRYVWLKPVQQAVDNMSSVGFVSMENQTPVIRGVNDSVEALHLLHRELRRGGIAFKYIFQCREIEGHKAFAVPVEEAWRLHNESQKGISDGGRSRFAMSTEWGKMEVVTVSEAGDALGAGGNGTLVMMKIHRSPFEATTQGDIVIARGNPKALWLSDYEDRIIYDGRKLSPLETLADEEADELIEEREVRVA
jgi:L-lysine 2,3-aminomutase